MRKKRLVLNKRPADTSLCSSDLRPFHCENTQDSAGLVRKDCAFEWGIERFFFFFPFAVLVLYVNKKSPFFGPLGSALL